MIGFNEDFLEFKNKDNILVIFFVSFLYLVDCFYCFDIFLFNKLSVCVDRNFGLWRIFMVILEYIGYGIFWIVVVFFVIFVFLDIVK